MGNRKHICIAVVAHVDAGKTTLSEAMLYLSGSIRQAGRVDNGDAFLDNDALERSRGITIFSKQAEFSYRDTSFTLLDTPGHVDFSAEMERTLQVLDYAVLLVSGADGVQGHTKTLWRLLNRYQIPTFLFVNKMDQNGADKEKLFAEIKETLSGNCVDFSKNEDGTFCDPDFYENAAVCEEEALEKYLESGVLEQEDLCRMIKERTLFPCFFGSALKMEGVREFLDGLCEHTNMPQYGGAFGAKVFKITRDDRNNRLTHMKITGGKLAVRDMVSGGGRRAGSEPWEEKISQIRIYSGEKAETVSEAEAGCVCAVSGLSATYPGEGLGAQEESELPLLEPVLTYQLLLPDGVSPRELLPKLRLLEEEDPELHIVWEEVLQEIKIQMMGEVQTEVLKCRIKERFDVDVEFGAGKILYRETIADTVEGVGHFEPLRHYAEVHLRIEPGEPGSGVVCAADCSEDLLARNWQRLILTHLEEKEHVGVLTGSAVTDIKITLVSGKAHIKHTEGGDFRQATYRAVRQGLMQAKSVLLEPYYEFRLEIPENALGRAMTDMERMAAKMNPPDRKGELAVLTGSVPVAEVRDYAKEVAAYSKGHGSLLCTFGGYAPCHNTQEVLARIPYDPLRDTANPCGSVFCAHGAGFVVEWDQVKDYMHLESIFHETSAEETWEPKRIYMEQTAQEEKWMGTDEIDRILNQTYNANKRETHAPGRNNWKLKGRSQPPVTRTYTPDARPAEKNASAEEYLLVDGYNIIFAWKELSALAAENIDGARGKLMDILCNYQGIRKCHLIVVFDAYRVKGHPTEIFDYHNIHVVYTKEAETADQYIEKFAHENGRKYRVTVATSDGLEQIIIRGAGCILLSARDLEKEIAARHAELMEQYQAAKPGGKTFLTDGLSQEAAEVLKHAAQKEEPSAT